MVPLIEFGTFGIEVDTVVKILKSLDPNKSMGPDCLSPRLLREGADSIGQALTIIFNKSLIDVEVPLDWKLANVVPVFKKGDRETIESYMPQFNFNC